MTVRDTHKKAWYHEARNVQTVRLWFPYSPGNIAEVKTLHGATWHPKGKYWSVSLVLDNLIALKKWNYMLCDRLREWGNVRYHVTKKVAPILHIPGLPGTLYPYQMEGVAYTEAMRGRSLIADEMGLGKTIQALAWVQLRRNDLRTVLIITTATMKGVWAEEAEKWVPKATMQVLSGTYANMRTSVKILIINYDILQYWVPLLQATAISAVIMDECHKVANEKTLRYKAVKKLVQGIPYVIGLTGTPMNKPRNLYAPVQLINPGLFPSKFLFLRRYCDAKHNGFGWTFDGSSNEEELHRLLTQNVMIRRLKKDVLKDLPEKTYTFVPIMLDNIQEYRHAERDFESYVMDKIDKDVRRRFKEELSEHLQGVVSIDEEALEELKHTKSDTMNVLGQIEELKQLAVRGKMKGLLQWVDDFLESEEKLVIFCEHRFVIEAFLLHYGKQIVKIDGSIPPEMRKEIVHRFQKDEKVRLFIGNKAAQEGLTLTRASNVAIIELPWTADALAQRIDRVHRITQTRGVNVWYLLAQGTIEEKIAKIIDENRRMAEMILDGKKPEQKDMITELLKNYGTRGLV